MNKFTNQNAEFRKISYVNLTKHEWYKYSLVRDLQKVWLIWLGFVLFKSGWTTTWSTWSQGKMISKDETEMVMVVAYLRKTQHAICMTEKNHKNH